MRIFVGTKATAVELPAPPEGVAGVGARIVTAVGGKLSTAGVYAVGKGAERVATVPAEQAEYRSGSMSAGRMWLLDQSLTDRPGGPIWQRTVEGASKPVLSAETRLGTRARVGQRVALSAGRAVSGDPAADGRYQIRVLRPRRDRQATAEHLRPRNQPGRLIGMLAAAAFTPDGDGAGDAWRPQFDISKPMTDVVLRIRRADGQDVRTLTGTAPDGSVRDIGWDGRDDAGAPLPAGVYTWTLSARNRDGEGGLIDVDGGRGVSGSVTLSGVRP